MFFFFLTSDDALYQQEWPGKIFTIFWVDPLVRVYRFRRSLTSMSLI